MASPPVSGAADCDEVASDDAASDDPFTRFAAWYEAAQRCGISEPTHMVLATVDKTGLPSARVVLLKAFDGRGFVFYTNTLSRKGKELDDNPKAALCFYWGPLGRQVRVRGPVERVPDDEADLYFSSRPRDSQLGAWASLQSETLTSRAELVERFAEVKARYEGQPVPRPPHWTGLRVVPDEIEFWEARENRLHHRDLFVREGERWHKALLYP